MGKSNALNYQILLFTSLFLFLLWPSFGFASIKQWYSPGLMITPMLFLIINFLESYSRVLGSKHLCIRVQACNYGIHMVCFEFLTSQSCVCIKALHKYPFNFLKKKKYPFKVHIATRRAHENSIEKKRRKTAKKARRIIQ